MLTATTPAQLGVLVRRRRKYLDLTQAELAGLSGLGERFVSEVERGKETAELGKVLRLLDRLGLGVVLVTKQ
jgi:HTH-type transcriptional regulator / antitoxin HipB